MLNALAKRNFSPIAVDESLDIAERVCRMRYETSAPPAFEGRKLLGCRIGAISLVHYESFGIERGIRSLEDIRAQPLDDFIVCVPLQARFQFSHAGLRSDVGGGAAVLLSAHRPFDAYISGVTHEAWHASLQVRVPGTLLRSCVPDVDQLCNRSFSVLEGAGAIMRATLQASMQQAHALTEFQAERQGHVLAELIANSIQVVNVGRTASLGHRSGERSVFERALSFIECQLSSPQLDAQLIARHCRVSLRYLHKTFAQHAQSVAATVREMRLVRCRAALRDARLAHRSIIDIAGDWGFSDPSHFARVYRKRFGVSPRQERRAHSLSERGIARTPAPVNVARLASSA